MQYGSWLLASIIDNEEGAREFVKLDPDPELFRGPEVELYDFVRGHIQKHGVTPARETVKKHLPEVSLPSDIPEPASYYHERMQKRHQHLELKKVVQQAASLLNEDQGDEAEQVVFDTLVDLRRVEYRRRVIDYAQEGSGLIKEHLLKMEKGLGDGIPLGWPYIDAMMGGMQPGDFNALIGRPGKGKTFMLLYIMLYGWRYAKTSPMFVSMEMNPNIITQRIVALDTHTSANQIKQGTVSKEKAAQMFPILIENKKRKPMWVIDGGLSATVDDILLHALEKKPNIIFIDGAYLLKAAGGGTAKRWERIADNAEAIKRDISEGLQIPVFASYQFNRDSAKKKKDKPGLEGIAGADAIGQITSLVLGMFEDISSGNVEQMKRRKIEVLKGRHGESGEFYANWVFDAPEASLWMDFSEWHEDTLEALGNL